MKRHGRTDGGTASSLRGVHSFWHMHMPHVERALQPALPAALLLADVVVELVGAEVADGDEGGEGGDVARSVLGNVTSEHRRERIRKIGDHSYQDQRLRGYVAGRRGAAAGRGDTPQPHTDQTPRASSPCGGCAVAGRVEGGLWRRGEGDS